ncbi:insulinoma-associated protein 1b [Parasteatoda tepidariorum]|uniref:insulinoma-associated protein 1b n=1 Tax=Parasteatoda tepidariorum TaxID=114398 RepID=UPI00077F812F|nr:insulinoma-associated protein 1b [Parasteatoda tepidariorum]
MPRGFLVKRFSKTSPPFSSPSSITASQTTCSPPHHQRVRRYSDEDRSDTSSDHELLDSSDILRHHPLFCHPGPPPLRSNIPQKSPTGGSDGDTPSPPFVDYNSDSCQDVPLALTTDKIPRSPSNGRIGNHIYQPFRNSVLYFQRFDSTYLPSTPPPLKSKLSPPHSAPASTGSSEHLTHSQPSTPKSCQPPKKRSADASLSEAKTKAAKKAKVVRKLNFDEDKSSPVSGTFIRDIDDDEVMLATSHPGAVKRGDIDPSLNVVVITEEARAELAKIENKIGDYVCQLCREHYDDAFGLAQHRCSRIVHVEYRCPECDKVFNCPANLASHRRWHKPRPLPGMKNSNAGNPPKLLSNNSAKIGNKNELKISIKSEVINKVRDGFSTDPSDTESIRDTSSPEVTSNRRLSTPGEDKDFECHLCSKKFSQYFYFRKHLLSHLTVNANGQLESDVIQSVFSKSISEKRTALARLNITPPPENEKSDKNSFVCTICGLSFHTKTEMEQHTFKHDELKGIQCKYCPSVFYSSAGLTRHINKHHPSENRQVMHIQSPVVRPLST